MENNVTEKKSVGAKGTSKLSLIIKSKVITLNGPWHFEEDEPASIKFIHDYNEINFDFLVNYDGSNNLIHPDDYDSVLAFIDHLNEGKSLDYHFKIITPQSEIKQLHGYGSILSTESLKEKISVELATINALHEKLSNLEIDFIRKQNEQLQRIMDAIPQMVWVYNVKARIDFFNESWYTYTGLTPERCSNFDHLKSDVFHPSQKPDIDQKWNECILSGVPYNGEILVKKSNGEFRWHLDLTTPIKNESGEVEMWVGTLTDVHEQFINENKLKENNDLLEAICNSSTNGIQVLETVRGEAGLPVDFVWKYYNKVAERTWGLKNYIGKRLSKESSTELKNGTLEKMKTVVRTGKSVQFEKLYKYGPHFYRWVDISIVKLGDGVVLNSLDITDRKTAEIELQKNRQRSDSDKDLLNNDFSVLSFVAGQPLSDPIQKMQSSLENLRHTMKDHLSEDGKACIKEMVGAVESLHSLRDDILFFAEMTSDLTPVEPVDLNEVLELVLRDLKDTISEKNAIVVQEKMPIYRCNASQFTKLLRSLMSNALKFQKPGTTPKVKIGCQFLFGDEIDLPAVDKKIEYLKLEVSDNGIGFEAQHIDNIFLPFQQLNNPSAFPGNGMGLALGKRIVENHKGFMIVKSKPGVGSSFACYFPVQK